MELFHANRQWSTRPADQRFESLEDMHTQCRQYANDSRQSTVKWADLSVAPDGDEVRLVGRKTNNTALITHYAFGQLAARAKAPAAYLRTLPAALAADCMNDGIKRHAVNSGNDASLLFHSNGQLIVRSATTTVYSRIWNHEVTQRLLDLQQRANLVPARQTFSWDGSALPNESKRPAALYASDHDMFAFMMSNGHVITDPTNNSLYRGIIVQNSEVGDKKLSVMSFFFREICANHIIWGASDLIEIDLMHQGNIRQRWLDAQVRIRRYFDGAASIEQAKFVEMKRRISDTKEGVLDALFGKRTLGIPRKTLEASYDAVIPEQDGDPRSVWGFAQGVTRVSRALPYADERQDLDRAAGRLLSMAF